jgi:SAM-dependent methyltransferase
MGTATDFPDTREALLESRLLNQWWYYGFELLPGIVTQGQFPPSMPLLPRLMLRNCRLRGMECLDVGTMEGLMPVLMARAGAKRVLAVDGVDHCVEKQAAVQHYYGVSFDYRTVGAMYSLSEKLGGDGFDLINCSGLLYHVLSPLMVLTGLRGALKRNGLMIVSTNVVVDREAFADFNARGRLQEEPNTFWYLSTGLLDYALRYLKLAPLSCLYLPHDEMRTEWRMRTGKASGYLSVLCRATDAPLPSVGDEWMSDSVQRSWEYEWLPDWERAQAQPLSRISTERLPDRPRDDLGFGRWQQLTRRAPRAIDITAAVEGKAVVSAAAPADSHTLRLADYS